MFWDKNFENRENLRFGNISQKNVEIFKKKKTLEYSK